MKATELRIGNYIFDREIPIHLRPSQLVNIIREDYSSCYEPIELTEEWLVKFGFVKFESYFYKKDDFMIWEDNNDYGLACCSYSCNIKYVHQLQNLYFALTNEELKL